MKITDKTTLKELPSLLAKGFCMGSADIVPGVSGGTMALILGIYQRLINAIKSVDVQVVQSALRLRLKAVFELVHWKFIVSLLSGMVLAIVFFTRIVKLPELMFVHPEPVYGLFFGLILGSVWYVSRDFGKITAKHILWMTIGAAIGFRIVTLVPVDSPENAGFVFLSGALAITAMILPGISGSFILLILRKYDYILTQLGELGGENTLAAILALTPFVLGMITGIVLFSRVLSWLLDRYYVATLCVLVGFMIGSLYVIWPFQERTYTEYVQQEVMLMENERVQLLLSAPESSLKPEYQRILDTVPGELLLNNDVSSDQSQVVVLETVKNKLVASEPFLPSFKAADEDSRLRAGQSSVILGFLMSLVGIAFVVILGIVAARKK